jgi:hypothetical protein
MRPPARANAGPGIPPAARASAGPAARSLRTGAVVAAAVLALAGCTASQPQPANGHASPSPAPAQVGATLPVSDSSGTKLDITLEQVIDPASGASQYSQPASGKHFVGVKLRIRNTAAVTFQNNANNETTIVLSNGQAGEADYNPIAGCGNFSNGQVKLASQASATGCVTFQVRNGEKVTEVRYHNSVFPGTTAEWRLP